MLLLCELLKMLYSTVVQQEGSYLVTSAATTVSTPIIYVFVGADGHQKTESYLTTAAAKSLGADNIIFTMVRQVGFYIVVAVLHCWPGCWQGHLYSVDRGLLKPML